LGQGDHRGTGNKETALNAHLNTSSETGRAHGTNGPAFHIALGVDENYIRMMAVTITSILENNRDIPIVFHVFTFSVSDHQRDKLRQLETKYGTTIQFHVIDPEVFRDFSTFPRFSQYSAAIFTRLLIPGALKGIASEVLYLDADILCVGSIAELRSMDLSGTIVAVVSDDGATTGKRQIAALKLKHQRYFNSGVLYIQVDNWIADNITQDAMRVILTSDKKLAFPDQDALNLVLDGRAQFIDEKWNFRYNLEVMIKKGDTRMDAAGRGVFLHFTGRVKPWLGWTLHESKALFIHYQSLSPWAGTPLDMPKNFKERHIYSRFLFKQGRLAEGFAWYLKYLSTKFLPIRNAG
jgi:lipopolysaccharide biosynthesis glycosyltransferase